jgi:MFS family permease
MYGRLWVFQISNVGYTLFTIACALAPSLGSLIVFRFLAGCFGIAPLTVGGGTISDLIAQEERGKAMAMWSLGPILGPVIGPIIGGFLADAKGWRWYVSTTKRAYPPKPN